MVECVALMYRNGSNLSVIVSHDDITMRLDTTEEEEVITIITKREDKREKIIFIAASRSKWQ